MKDHEIVIELLGWWNKKKVKWWEEAGRKTKKNVFEVNGIKKWEKKEEEQM